MVRALASKDPSRAPYVNTFLDAEEKKEHTDRTDRKATITKKNIQECNQGSEGTARTRT